MCIYICIYICIYVYRSLTNLPKVVCSNQQHMQLCRFSLTVLTDSGYDYSEDSYTRNADAYMANWYNRDEYRSVVLGEEDCERIRSDFLNDDCMKLDEEEQAFFNLPNSNACCSDSLSFPSA